MAQNSALSTLKDLAEKEVDDAALQLGAMRRGCQQAEEQLKMLIDYQHEYRTNLNTDMTQGIGSQRWINYQQFIQTLEKALEQHRQQLNQWTQKVDTALNFWREKKQRLQAWQTLQDRQIAASTLAENRLDQKKMDEILIHVDGTDNKNSVGANATLGVSMAVARAAAMALRIPLYQYLGGCHASRLPVPMMNILNGGRHADNTVDLQEFMIMPVGSPDFREGIRMCVEIYQFLRILLKERNLSTAVGDEGGFAPDLKDARAVLELMTDAIQKAGYKPGEDVKIAIDAAASELYDEERGCYYFPGESRQKGKEILRDTKEMIAYYEDLLDEFPIISIEDGLQEDDWEGWKQMTETLGGRVQLVGDDLFVTNIKRLKCGIRLQTANAILIKMNQIGTLSEAMDAVEMAQKAGYRAVVSHRSGETEDSFIADLAVAVGAGQIKTGAPCRSDRTSKYNQLLRICDTLENTAVYENPFVGENENYQKEN